MDNQSQNQILEKALQLETKKQSLEQAIPSIESSIQGVRNQKPPAPPVMGKVEKEKPPKIKPTAKYNFLLAFLPFAVTILLKTFLADWIPSLYFTIAFLLPLCGFFWIFVYTFLIYMKARRKNIETIRSSPEYAAQCNAIEEQFQQQKYAAEFEYAQAKQIYDTQTLPAFEQKRSAAIAELEAKKKAALSELSTVEQELEALYDACGLIPIQYRNIPALSFIYNTIHSSRVDITTAFHLYEQKKQQEIEEEKLRQYQRELDLREQEIERERNRQAANEFFSGVAATAAGSYIGNRAANRGERKELQKQTAYLKKQTEIAEQEAKKRAFAEDERKRREAHESQLRWDAVSKENEKRRRKGQPELPLPPRWYY